MLVVGIVAAVAAGVATWYARHNNTRTHDWRRDERDNAARAQALLLTFDLSHVPARSKIGLRYTNGSQA